MVFYKCPRCNFNSNDKTKYVNHLKRKIICKPIISKTNLQNEYVKFNISEKIKCQQNVNMLSTNLEKCQQNVNICQQNKEYKCEFCDKKFNSRQGKWRHLKNCNNKKKDEEDKNDLLNLVNLLNEKIENKDKQLEEKNKQINELIKKVGINIGTQNIQQNIKILAYDNTDLSLSLIHI